VSVKGKVRLAALAVRRPSEFVDRMRVRSELRTTSDHAPNVDAMASDVFVGVHELLGVPRCTTCEESFAVLWPKILERIPDANYHDASESLGAAVWSAALHRAPERVVETGVAHGVTTALILAALERNAAGHLWSIDLPPLSSDWHGTTAVAVPGDLRARWTYRRGAVDRYLVPLLGDLGTIDLYIHDALHTERSMAWEFEQSWPRVVPGGVLISDDVHMNMAFERFAFTDGVSRAFYDRTKRAAVGVAVKSGPQREGD
jgi:predicted O-methyltransferase YrrM